jgi:CBS domain-containing protein
VTLDATVYDAVTMMVENKVGSTLIKDDTRIVGIYTERDLMRNCIDPNFDMKTARMGDYMSKGLKFAPHTDSAYELMDKFLGLRLRHLLIDRDDEFIGLLSIGDVIKAALQDKTKEFTTLARFANWEYHEEWKPRQ